MAAKKAPAKRAPTKSTAAPLAQVAPAAAGEPSGDVHDLDGIPLTMTIEVGRAHDTIGRVQEYGEQTLVELDRLVSDPVDVLLNGVLWARGEVVTVGASFGVRVVEILSQPGD